MKVSDIKLIRKAYTYWKYRPPKEIKEIFKKFPDKIDDKYFSEIKYKKILFCPFNPHTLNIVRESLLAYACKLRGAEVKMISYDLYLDAIDFITPKTKKDISVSYQINKKMYNIVKLPVIYMSNFFDDTKSYNIDFKKLTRKDIENFTYDDIFLSDLIISSSVRYFLCNEPEWDTPEFIDTIRKFAKTAVVLVDVYKKILLEEKPDKIVASHGVYVSWGTLLRVARKLNIPIDIYGASYRRNTLRFYHNEANAPLPLALWPKYKNIELTKEQEEIVDKYFKTRETQSEDSITLFDETSTFPESLKKFISEAKENNQKIYGLFANIAWDAFMFKTNTQVFESMVEWIRETFEYFAKNNKAKLIIKAHPAELYHKTPPKHYIRNILPKELPENIYFIDNNANVKPFDLYPYLDAGLTYLSTVTLEMALKNMTVITAGDISQYSNNGFTIDPKSKQEYFELIDKFTDGKLTFEPDITMAKRYLFYRFFREALCFDYIDIEKYQVKSLKINDINDLAPGKNQDLDIICNGILNDGDFLSQTFN